MKNVITTIICIVGSVVSVAIIVAMLSKPYTPAYSRPPAEFDSTNAVMCCCQTARGGVCCGEVSVCTGFIPGCYCQ